MTTTISIGHVALAIGCIFCSCRVKTCESWYDLTCRHPRHARLGVWDHDSCILYVFVTVCILLYPFGVFQYFIDHQLHRSSGFNLTLCCQIASPQNVRIPTKVWLKTSNLLAVSFNGLKSQTITMASVPSLQWQSSWRVIFCFESFGDLFFSSVRTTHRTVAHLCKSWKQTCTTCRFLPMLP